MEVVHKFGDRQFRLQHFFESELTCLPKFYIANLGEYGRLAHVTPSRDGSYGGICIGDQDSVSVNYERQGLAFEESLKRHIDLLEKAVLDADWNKQELLREFYSNWLAICDRNRPEFVCAASGGLEEILVFSPVQGFRRGFEGRYLGITDSASELADYSYIAQQGKRRTQVGLGLVVPVSKLKPAPYTDAELQDWYLDTISDNHIPSTYAQKRGRRFWLIFNADTPSGRTWFGVALNYDGNGKKPLPTTEERLKRWSITPLRVTIFNKERLMPRSGADLDLDNKSVLVVGCGSVGGEIAYKLGAAGIGKLVLSDPDVYSIDNIYRHVLSDRYFSWNKAAALCHSLHAKYPWVTATFYDKELLDLRDMNILNSFDLIIIAIGSPTHERKFHDFLEEENVKVPVINTWLEGYGIGGHAVLDIRNSHGCLRCAYVDLEFGTRGLSSNLNFLEPNQDLTVNHAGCGELFLPYNAVSAAQTALIATNLAIGSLLRKITDSSKVSWKGDGSEVNASGYSLAHRYTAFNKSLQVLPLYNEECDLCHE
ncbi:MAG: ThiF family adenylyltransferase [Candidatus Thiodiazotropha sp. (ex Lucinoma borealis)]|nr:ThiF family adenylyltransferase [Candidatus Thiodiazotropha sp. (ex Lucinoma borealis)]MCU7866134.1 ThiF family adenylyltransferase [Candidatus Thiodiazotropha sp. (ex Lucinoma borealis)]